MSKGRTARSDSISGLARSGRDPTVLLDLRGRASDSISGPPGAPFKSNNHAVLKSPSLLGLRDCCASDSMKGLARFLAVLGRAILGVTGSRKSSGGADLRGWGVSNPAILSDAQDQRIPRYSADLRDHGNPVTVRTCDDARSDSIGHPPRPGKPRIHAGFRCSLASPHYRPPSRVAHLAVSLSFRRREI